MFVTKNKDGIVIVNVSTRKAAKLTTEEYEEIIDDTRTIAQNKTIVTKELVENCKPFVASSILFVSVSVTLTGIVVYFYVKSRQRCFALLKLF